MTEAPFDLPRAQRWFAVECNNAAWDLLDKPGLVGVRPDERNVAYKQEGLPPTAILTRATMIKIAVILEAATRLLGRNILVSRCLRCRR